MDEIFVGRQPILDADGNFFSYELLYRNSSGNSFSDVNPELATIEVIINSFLAPGFEEIAARKTFINFSASLLASDIFDTLDPERVVIEILKDVELTYALLAKIEKLTSAGFEIALDSFILKSQYIINPELLQFITYIRVDFSCSTEAQRSAIEGLKAIYPHLILLADKVETEEQFEAAKSVGYELFQGFLFAQPELIKSTRLPTNVSRYFDILKLLNEEVPNIEDIANLIMKDISLTYKLLKYMNTYAFKSSEKVTSIQQAIVKMGLQKFNKWIQFLTIYQKNSTEPSGMNKALVDFSLTRATLCEMLAVRSGKHNSDEYFMLGMFSLIDEILFRERSEIFPALPVPEKIIKTLTGEQTEMTPYLRIAEALEHFDYSTAILLADQLGISEKELSQMALDAFIVW